MRSVKPGVNDETTTQVEGLNPGEVVANSSFEKLQDKEKVIISRKPADTDDTGSDAP